MTIQGNRYCFLISSEFNTEKGFSELIVHNKEVSLSAKQVLPLPRNTMRLFEDRHNEES